MYKLNLAIVNGEVVIVDEEAIQEQRRKEARKKAARQIQEQMSFILFQDIDPKQDFEELIGSSYVTTDNDKIKGFNARKLAAEIAPKAPCMVFVNIDGEKKLLTQYSGTRPVVINCQLKAVSNYDVDSDDEIFGRFDPAFYWGCYGLDEEEIEAQVKEVGDYMFKFRGYRRKGGNCSCYDNKHGDACCKKCTWYNRVQKKNQAAKEGRYWTDYYITS